MFGPLSQTTPFARMLLLAGCVSKPARAKVQGISKGFLWLQLYQYPYRAKPAEYKTRQSSGRPALQFRS